DLDLPWATLRMVIQGLLAPDRHRGHKSFFVKELCYRAAATLSRRRKYRRRCVIQQLHRAAIGHAGEAHRRYRVHDIEPAEAVLQQTQAVPALVDRDAPPAAAHL